MILDTSAAVAIMCGEEDADALTGALRSAEQVRVSTGTVLELSLVMRPARAAEVDYFLTRIGAITVPCDSAQLEMAREAHVRYGRGSGSPARLNFGDCFAYALAKVSGEPLLFKGEDFRHSDLTAAL